MAVTKKSTFRGIALMDFLFSMGKAYPGFLVLEKQTVTKVFNPSLRSQLALSVVFFFFVRRQ